MSKKKTVVAIIASLAFVVGGFFAGGALTTDAAVAQSDEAPVADSVEDPSKAPYGHGRLHGHGPVGFGGGGDGAAVVEDVLGLSSDEIKAALESGMTLAELAEQQGVDAEELIAALYTAATERIDAAVDEGALDAERAADIKAELEARITDRVEDGFTPKDGRMGFRGHDRRGLGGGVDVLTDILDMTPDELRAAVAGGATLAEVAEDQGVNPLSVIGALVDAATERIDAAVDDGRMPTEQAADIKAELETRITERVENGSLGGRIHADDTDRPHRSFPHRGHGPGFDGQGDLDGNAEETLGDAA